MKNELAAAQHSDGSFEIVSDAGAEPSLATKLSIHATLLDLLSQHEAANVTESLARYVAHELFDESFVSIVMGVDTRAVFHALAAVYAHDAALVPTAAIAASVHFLTSREVEPGGPYINVLAADNHADYDTNLSIARFLHQLGGPFPKLLDYAAQTKSSDYFVEDWAQNLQHDMLARDVHKKFSTTSALPNDAYFYRNVHGGQTLYGSPATTYMQQTHRAKTRQSPKRRPINQQAIIDRAAAAAPTEVVANMLAHIAAGDQHSEIGLFAARFAASVNGKTLTRQTLETLGAANLLNWTAYTIYDDILDDEASGAQLPAANMAMRAAVRLFKEAVPDAGFAKLIDEHFDTVDAANDWELAHCRMPVTRRTIRLCALPNYADWRHVYDRSLTHRLPMIGTLVAAGLATDDERVALLSEAFAQYLTIRQLSDDLHDWREDVRAGRITYVVAHLLADARTTAGRHAFDKLLPKLEHVFLHKTLPAIATEQLIIAEQAQQPIQNTDVVATPNALAELVEAYANGARSLLTEQRNGLALLNAFPA